ncbi:MAG TPA: tail fiber domain-containing protein [Rhizomicrobium sp.]|jgi:hypothetical protein
MWTNTILILRKFAKFDKTYSLGGIRVGSSLGGIFLVKLLCVVVLLIEVWVPAARSRGCWIFGVACLILFGICWGHSMRKTIFSLFVVSLLGLAALTLPVQAQTCPATPPNSITNGQTADATPVMGNFNSIFSCASLLAPLDSPNFTTRAGINSTSVPHLLDVNYSATYSTTNTILTYIGGTFTSSTTASTMYGLQLIPTFQATGSASALTDALIEPRVYGTGSTNFTYLRGVEVIPSILSGYSGTISHVYGVHSADISNSSGLQNVTTFHAFHADASTNGDGLTSGTVSNFAYYGLGATASAASGGTINNYGMYVSVGTGSGAGTTTNYGVRIAGNGGSGGSGTTTNYGVYEDSTATNYFNGSVGIGTTTPSLNLYVNGTAGGTSAWSNTSDARLKKNIAPINDALGLIEQMQGVRFDWRKPDERSVGSELKLPVDQPQVGFIAQDLQKILPEAVSVSKDDRKLMSVSESKVVPVLVEAIKQLAAANRIQTAQIDRLQARLDKLQRSKPVRTTAGDASPSSLQSAAR